MSDRNETKSPRKPVTDWATDLDHMDPRWTADPYPIWSELRQSCPIAHSERYGGVHLPTRYDDVREIASDPARFSSKRPVVRANPPKVRLPSPPISSDPPHHGPARQLLLPVFAPKAIDKLVPRTREICTELLDAIGDCETCDAAVNFAQHVPPRVIAMMLGVPEKDGDLFRHWIHVFLEETIADEEGGADRLVAVSREMDDYFRPFAEARRREPRDDLISHLVHAEMNGKPLTDNHFYGTLRLLLIAGIDTTWSAIGSSLLHLASVEQDRRRLAAEPALIPTAVEEFLRAYAPVTMARQVVADTSVSGCPMKAGEMILLAFPAANRDPALFPNPDEVIIDRKENRHATFGLGIHRCLGSNLARMELRTAIELWMARFPEFSLVPGGTVEWSKGAVRGPRTVPVRIHR
ncbi:MAG TPA: cytochrome P450 [Hyphomicrobiaceae bacterium]|nr:cytochrome P450 [Hyphomicrobiaceae bacterium]